MPQVDGYEFVRRLRAGGEGEGRDARFVPAVALSAFADRDAEARARDAGFQRFLAKPYEFPDLIAAVRDVTRIGPA